ncbi:MAG TPA: hypothetical protein VFV38_52430 [Ktedonobacteraceae bacterium]|nr:hypothetical protein [Ktedonobacteraceae bacterium]
MGKIDLYFDSVEWAPVTGEEILREYFQSCQGEVWGKIDQEPRDTLLTVNQHNFVTQLVTKYRIEPLSILEDHLVVADYTASDSSSLHHPHGQLSTPYSRLMQVIVFRLPCKGAEEVWKHIGRDRGHHQHQACWEDQEIIFEIKNRERDVIQIQTKAREMLALIRKRIALCNPAIAAYNASLYTSLSHIVEQRRQWLHDNVRMVSEIVLGLRSASEDEKQVVEALRV